MPPRGGADDAQVVALGAGEGAAAVAEQLALEQVARDGGAVERHERFLGAIGEVVDRAGEDFLAGTALAGDEDVDVGPRDALGEGHLLTHVTRNDRLAINRQSLVLPDCCLLVFIVSGDLKRRRERY